MAVRRAYLDYNATAPMRPEAADAIARLVGKAGNPSAVHGEGRAAKAVVEKAREAIARHMGAKPANVIFTSGGTEANVTALSSSYREAGRTVALDTLFVSAVEHPSVLNGGRFPRERVRRIPVDRFGVVDCGWLTDELARERAEGRRALVSVMLANNETGAVQPAAEVAAIVHRHDGILHADAVQVAGRLPLDIVAIGADLVSLSAHKLGGPTGVGALVLADGDRAPAPLLTGGGQELNRRAGTEPVLGIAGFAAIADVLQADAGEMARLAQLRDRLEAGIGEIAAGAEIVGRGAPRLANTTCFTAPGLNAETAVIAFDLEGVAISAGSACSSGKVTPSHVLAAMGLAPALQRGAIRVSLGWASNEDDIEQFLTAWKALSGRLLPADRTGRAA